jgi:hypothetical protein
VIEEACIAVSRMQDWIVTGVRRDFRYMKVGGGEKQTANCSVGKFQIRPESHRSKIDVAVLLMMDDCRLKAPRNMHSSPAE